MVPPCSPCWGVVVIPGIGVRGKVCVDPVSGQMMADLAWVEHELEQALPLLPSSSSRER